MPGRTIIQPASPPRVAFDRNVSSIRQAREDETYVMLSFATHASHCPRCADPSATYRRGDTLCERGHAKARDVAQYIYNKAGAPFSVTDRVRTGERIQVEVPAGCQPIRSLLKAIDRGLRIHEKSEARGAAVSQDRHHYVQERSPPRERRPEADIVVVKPAGASREERRPRYEGRGSGYRRDELERQQRTRAELDPVIIVAAPRGSGGRSGRYNR